MQQSTPDIPIGQRSHQANPIGDDKHDLDARLIQGPQGLLDCCPKGQQGFPPTVDISVHGVTRLLVGELGGYRLINNIRRHVKEGLLDEAFQREFLERPCNGTASAPKSIWVSGATELSSEFRVVQPGQCRSDCLQVGLAVDDARRCNPTLLAITDINSSNAEARCLR